MQDGYTCTNHSKNTSVYSYTHVHVNVQVLVHHQFNIVHVFADSNLHPFLEQINQIDENVTALEQAAYKLDNYSKRLGLFRVNRYCKGILNCFTECGLHHLPKSQESLNHFTLHEHLTELTEFDGLETPFSVGLIKICIIQ